MLVCRKPRGATCRTVLGFGRVRAVAGRPNISVGVVSYQSERLYLLRRDPSGGLMVHEQMFQRSVGLHYRDDTLYLATQANIYRMPNIIRSDQIIDGRFTECFVAQTAHLTGYLDAHDIGVQAD